MSEKIFFLGGADLEMTEIGRILAEAGMVVVDKCLGWGAKASAYADEIAKAVADGLVPVLVELELDIELPVSAIVVDHHNERVGEPASILQVLNLLCIEPSRKHQLIGANDSGYIPAMQAMGATPEEIAEIRLADRNAQGITPEQEAEAERAIANAEVVGKLIVVRMSHSKTATVADRLFGKADQLLILSGDGEVNFFGNGAICSDLKAKFEGWGGGAGFGKADDNGYWGGYPNYDEVLNFVKGKVNPAYTYAILDPRPIPVAVYANNKIFAVSSVVGIEVTVPALADQCIYNIDPQHTGNNHELAAIELAVQMVESFYSGRPCCGGGWDSYYCPKCDGAQSQPFLPPIGSTLATVRTDLDSVGAMAIFALCAEKVDLVSATERIELIATSDKFARGGWQGAKALPTAEHLYDDSTASADSDSRLAPIAAAISDFKVPLADRVAVMEHWLLTGEEPAGYRDRWIAERQALAKAIADGTIDAIPVVDGKIAQVISTHRAATSIGYCIAPVVVALNPKFQFQGSEPHAKFTICQFTSGYVDLGAVKAELSELETGWGGSPTIIGSPQGMSSTLSIDQVVEVVAKHLK